MEKICKVCNIKLDISNFNKRRNGYRNECRSCKSEYLKRYRKGLDTIDLTINKGIKITTKKCNTCEQTKDINLFVKQKRQCKDCKSQYLKNYNIINADKIKLKSRENYKKKFR